MVTSGQARHMEKLREMKDLLPISDTECEKMVLGTIISRNGTMEEFGDMLDIECFTTQRNKDIFSCVKKIIDRGDSPEIIPIKAELDKTTTKLELYELVEISSYRTFELGQYVARLKELSARRKLYELSYFLLQNGTTEINELQDVLSRAEKSIGEITSGAENHLKTSLDFASEVYEQIKNNMTENAYRGMPTGFHMIDEKGGFSKNNLIVIAAASSQGKTSLASSITLFGARYGAKIAYYSLEMTGRQLMYRFAAMESGINSLRIKNEKLSDWELDKVSNSLGSISQLPIYFDDRSSSSIDSIISSIRSMKIKKDIDGVVIDYLQILTLGKSDREEQLAEAARRFKNLAKELDIWIMLLSQLNRDKENPIPNVDRLRGSGQINEAADTTILIYRPEVYDKNYPKEFQTVEPKGTALIDVAKGRDIGTFKFIAGFDKNTTRFYELSSLPQKGHIEDETTPF